MLEPVPLRKTPWPPAVADRVDLARRDAEVLLADVYQGPGLRGVSRGTIKSLRVISYQFAYRGMGGEPDAPGLDGPWDVKRILGTVPVWDDGSARFLVPAYTPIAVQPLDAEGKAVQLMRSWFTAMPGEVLSCIGCHEHPNRAPPPRTPMAAMQPAEAIRPWYGPARGFDFRREVQPVLDRHCLACHDGRREAANRPGAAAFVAPDLTDRPASPTLPNRTATILPRDSRRPITPCAGWSARRRGKATCICCRPGNIHADTTHLVQMLQKGHHGVRLDAESWDRLVTWIDLNAPAHGTWTDICGDSRVQAQRQRRRELRRQYTGMDDDPEAILSPYKPPPEETPARLVSSTVSASVRPPQASLGTSGTPPSGPPRNRATIPRASRPLAIPLDGKVTLELVRIPAGRFVMGEADGCQDERPPCEVSIDRPFWLGRFEITNEQFALFDPLHDSGLEHGDYIQFSPGERGWTLLRTRQPAVRVAARGDGVLPLAVGEDRPALRVAERGPMGIRLSCGHVYALVVRPAGHRLLAVRQRLRRHAPGHRPVRLERPGRGDSSLAARRRAVQRSFTGFRPGRQLRGNPWGLFDMHGNVAEWTRSAYVPYPYRENDGRNAGPPEGTKVVRGGSGTIRPTAAARRSGWLTERTKRSTMSVSG